MPLTAMKHQRVHDAMGVLADLGITASNNLSDQLRLIHQHGDYLRQNGIDVALIPTHDREHHTQPLDPHNAARAHLQASGAGDRLNFDGTLDSLRGVPLDDLDGIGSKTLDAMRKAGINDVWDLLMRIPRRYLDRTNIEPFNAIQHGREATFIARIRTVQTSYGGRGRTPYARFTLADPANQSSASVTAMFFQAAWMAKRFTRGDTVIVHGHVGEFNGRCSMSSPLMTKLAEDTAPIVGLYPQSTTNGLSTWDIQRAAIDALRRIPVLDDPIPEHITSAYHLPSRLEALRAVHVPASVNQATTARQRLVFDELFRLQLALGVLRNSRSRSQAVEHAPTGQLHSQWVQKLPYELTGAQQRAIQQITASLTAPQPMNLLLQGDVGAGKTAVCAAAAIAAVEGGHQAVLAAPSEILARQHFEELHEVLTPLGITVDLLVSKGLPRPKKATLADIADGTTNILVGTHAVFGDALHYHSLGLVIVDEQHRFGVDQRAALAGRGPGGADPDILQATATPIPRTAAITEFGDMEVAVLDEKPAGRKPVVTRHDETISATNPGAQCWAEIRDQVQQGRQAFVVCPLVMTTAGKASETKMAAAAEDVQQQLLDNALRGLSIGLVHGKQKPAERKATMEAFTRGDLNVLVATTVIEVGVSVPNATVMVILEAGRFGLAQLHQLRGRVGRGQYPGVCWLGGEVSSDGQARMDAMCATNDGFALSEMDLKIRGPGSLISTAQAGKDSGLVLTDLLADEKIHVAARIQARKLLSTDPLLRRHRLLRSEVSEALGEQSAYLLRS